METMEVMSIISEHTLDVIVHIIIDHKNGEILGRFLYRRTQDAETIEQSCISVALFHFIILALSA